MAFKELSIKVHKALGDFISGHHMKFLVPYPSLQIMDVMNDVTYLQKSARDP
jgi:hypothetical protein